MAVPQNLNNFDPLKDLLNFLKLISMIMVVLVH